MKMSKATKAILILFAANAFWWGAIGLVSHWAAPWWRESLYGEAVVAWLWAAMYMLIAFAFGITGAVAWLWAWFGE